MNDELDRQSNRVYTPISEELSKELDKLSLEDLEKIMNEKRAKADQETYDEIRR